FDRRVTRARAVDGGSAVEAAARICTCGDQYVGAGDGGADGALCGGQGDAARAAALSARERHLFCPDDDDGRALHDGWGRVGGGGVAAAGVFGRHWYDAGHAARWDGSGRGGVAAGSELWGLRGVLRALWAADGARAELLAAGLC